MCAPREIPLIRSSSQLFVGTHDFRAFSGQLEQKAKQKGGAVPTVRTIYDVRLIDEGAGLYKIDFHLQGALYKMVRNMVGTALNVAKGDVELAELKRLLDEAPPRKENKSKVRQRLIVSCILISSSHPSLATFTYILFTARSCPRPMP